MFKKEEKKSNGYTKVENEDFERTLSAKKNLEELKKSVEERKKCEEEILKVRRNLMTF